MCDSAVAEQLGPPFPPFPYAFYHPPMLGLRDAFFDIVKIVFHVAQDLKQRFVRLAGLS